MSAAHAPCYAMLGVATFIVPQRLSLDTRVSLFSWLGLSVSKAVYIRFALVANSLPVGPVACVLLGFLSLAVSLPPLLTTFTWASRWTSGTGLYTRQVTTHSRRHLSTLALTYNIWRLHATFMLVTFSGLLSRRHHL